MAKQPLIPPAGKKVKLSEYDPEYTGDHKDKDAALAESAKDLKRMEALQDILYAEAKQSILIVCQGIDTGGKDGTIKHVFSGVNPQGVSVISFKAPTSTDLAHDYLWRVHPHVPAKGHISIFNRSHYEDVLVVRVHNLVPSDQWKRRYDQINDFERLLSQNGTRILKFFLYISKDEQKKRLLDRIQDPTKNWKFAMGDLDERKLWDDYIEAYEDMLTKCNTDYAPWYIVPANKKWYRNLVISKVVAETLESMKPVYPKAPPGLDKVVIPD